MTTFTMPDPATPAPPADSGQPLAGDAFFPTIDPGKFTTIMRLAAQITPERVRDALIDAILTVDRDETLQRQKAAWLMSGYGTLADVPADQFGGEHKLEFLYRRAVYNFAKAALDEKYRDNAMTDAGERRAEGVDVTVGSHVRNARNALSDLVGRRRATVELL